jgi:hypothetical protein
MASADALKTLIAALETEQARRLAARFGGRDPRTWFLEELQQMAERLAATAHLCPITINDMSIIEKLACRYFLPEGLCPEGLGTADEIWAEHRSGWSPG